MRFDLGHGNAFDATLDDAAVASLPANEQNHGMNRAAGDTSAVIESPTSRHWTVFGNAMVDDTLEVLCSANANEDAPTWYETGLTIPVLAGVDFFFHFESCAHYHRLRTVSGNTLTATLACKE